MNALRPSVSFCLIKIRTKCGSVKNGRRSVSWWWPPGMYECGLYVIPKNKFSSISSIFRVLKKCGKKMPRYCDVNNDKKITLSEWLNCLQVNGNDAKPKSPDSSEWIELCTIEVRKFLRNISSYRSGTTNTEHAETEGAKSIGFVFEKWLISIAQRIARAASINSIYYIPYTYVC